MNTFKNFHPITLFFYFLFVLFISIFSFNPLFLLFGFFGSISFYACISDFKAVFKSIIFYIILIFAVTATNPIFSHNGATVLFFINDNRITLEALIYGAVLGLMIAVAVIWFRCFNLVFDSEKILYFLGKSFPRLALVFSMTLNFIPNLLRSFKNINTAQRLSGKKNSRIKRYLNSFSAVITQSMENAMITSDSMKARGYGLKKRTFYSRFKFTFYDLTYLAVSIVLFSLSLAGNTSFEFYPYFVIPKADTLNILSYISFLILSFIPFLFEVKEGAKWKFLISKI